MSLVHLGAHREKQRRSHFLFFSNRRKPDESDRGFDHVVFSAGSGRLNGPGNFRMHGRVTIDVNVGERAVPGFRAAVSARDHRQTPVESRTNSSHELLFSLVH